MPGSPSFHCPAPTRLIDNDVLAEGAHLRFSPQTWGNAETAAKVAAWIAEDASRGDATWTAHRRRPLQWQADGQTYSPTGLTKHIFEQATGERPQSMHGTRFWSDDQDRDLVTLAESANPGDALPDARTAESYTSWGPSDVEVLYDSRDDETNRAYDPRKDTGNSDTDA